ncbi:MAG: hypothetical protein QOJ15_10615, partial [Bradyrhizobium sp.]|nr:hypothetical protein [Bradyrhizobium sp.]
MNAPARLHAKVALSNSQCFIPIPALHGSST